MIALKWLLIGLIGAYAALLLLMFVFQRALMYFPNPARTPPAAAGLPEVEELILTSADGEKLVAWFRPPRDGKPLIVYFHGNADALAARNNRFRWMIDDGYGLLAPAYRGYSGSTGYPSEAGLILDGKAAYAFAAARFKPEQMVLFGESLGTAVAIAVAADHKVAGLVLDAPFSSAADVGAAAYPFIPVRWLIKDSFRSDQRIANVSVPILVLHGERDTVVPIAFAERLFALAPGPKRMLRYPLGAHLDLEDYGAKDGIREFLRSLQ
jgi:fermentation-respiration switch protein FrsA (DUF1100 family)